MQALEARQDVVILDAPIEIPPLPLHIARVAGLRIANGKLASTWRLQPNYVRLTGPLLRKAIAVAGDSDATLSIGTYGPSERPVFAYQDDCYDAMIGAYDKTGTMPLWCSGMSPRSLRKMASIQNHVYSTLKGLFTMSAWNADHIIKRGLMDPQRVWVVGAGVNVALTPMSHVEFTARETLPMKTFLFIGRDFHLKAGDVVVKAFLLAQKLTSHPMRLIVAGPKVWPMKGEIPAGIDFLGETSASKLTEIMKETHVYVMPSRSEAFGIAIVEALRAAIPAIGRRGCAMQELIKDGIGGELLAHEEAEDPRALAQAMLRVLNDANLRYQCFLDAPRIASYYTWDRVAHDMATTIRKVMDS